METQTTRAECTPKPSPEERGRALVEDWQRSGLSQVAYARQHRIGAQRVSYWKRRLEQARPATVRAPTAAPAADFVQIAVPMPSRPTSLASQPGSPLEILLSCGAVVRVVPGVDPGLLRLVVSTLAGDGC
jgi:hypothetical protein